MPNNLGLAGAQPQKQTKFTPLYTGRWSSGIWTNRSPLRDAATSRIAEKFYGQAGDALIAGSNVEITNKLTLARRPGTSVFDSNSYSNVDRFYEFRLFNQNTEEIIIMVDQSNALYSLESGTKTLVFTKSTGSGETYMQSVGNILYFADGIDNKKWLQTLNTWQANFSYGVGTTPFLTTYIIDVNGNIQQLYGTYIPINSFSIVGPTSTSGPIVTLHSSVTLSNIVAVGDILETHGIFTTAYAYPNIPFPDVTILSITGTSMTVNWPFPTDVGYTFPYTSPTITAFCYAINAGTPVSGSTIPTFSTVTPSVSTRFQGGITIDNSVVWVNRGAPVENWGIANTNNVPVVPQFSPSSNLGDVNNLQFWKTGTSYGSGSFVVDANNNVQEVTTGGTPAGPEPNWAQTLGATTTDGTTIWTLVYLAAQSPQNGGYRYSVALVNSLDNTVSNGSPMSAVTGNFIGSQGIFLAPGAGLPPITRAPHSALSNTVIDTQSDYVAIFRTTDGQSVPFLIPGQNGQTWTVSLSSYLNNGYLDTTLDTGLDNLISAPINDENTPPPVGALNLTYHLNRNWYSIGNVVYWTSGPDDPAGNGLNGSNPLNFDYCPSLVKRLVKTTAGMLVFTVSDVYIIQGLGTASSPIQGSQPLLPGIGLLNYNALDTNGAIIGMFTTDNQFVILDPSNGVSYAGFPIGDQFRLNNGTPGQSWNPNNVYVAWHVQGEDAAWYVADGTNGWYRLMSTPAPETGYTWSPFATIVGGVQAVQSIEVSPGIHQLLLGPTMTGPISKRDLSVFSDDGTPYPAYAVIGSAVLTQPGQIALVDHIVTDAVKIGSPLTIGLLIDEALPYYTGPIDIIKNWESDPPNLPESRSLYSQRFYLSQLREDAAACRHMQIQVIFSPADTVMNELFTLSIFGSYQQEI